jgi:hypothetical protein
MSSLAKRQRVVEIALQQAYEGAHYLWGSQGSTPNQGLEVKFNPKSLNPSTVSFCAAQCSRSGGLQVCGGRFAQKALAAVWKGPPGSAKGPVSPSDSALRQWIADNGHYHETDWDDTLTPRLTKGVGVTTQIVWGEGCDGTRHFDCISFINWCLRKVAPKWQTADIPHFFYSIEPRGAAVQALDVTDEDLSDVMPADILLYGKVVKPSADYFRERIANERAEGKKEEADADQAAYERDETSASFRKDYHIPVVPRYGVGVGLHHIGFATGKGNQRVHASDNSNGVIIDTWGDPVRRVRLPDTWFI